MTSPDQPGQQPQWEPQPHWQPQSPSQPQQQWQPQQPQWAEPTSTVGLVAPRAVHNRRGRLLAASAAAVVVVGGAVATYAAVRSSSDNGATSPRQAVQRVVADLNDDDLVGVLDDMAPNERAAIASPFMDTVKQLERNGVVRGNANLKKVDGVDFKATKLTFAAQTISIDNHVEIVQLTGGTLHFSADATKLPLTARFLHAVAPHGLSPSQARTAQTVDIGREVRASGKPVRIAVQKSGERWYPSLFYTIADNAVADGKLTAPGASQRIPDVGAASADDAVSTMVKALLGGDVRRAIELASPDELAVLHDYGALVVDRVHYRRAPITIKSIAFRDTPANGGGVRVHVSRLDISTPDGEVTATMDGSCVNIVAQGHDQRMCADQILGQLGGAGGHLHLAPAQKTALQHVFAGFTDVGVIATRSGGAWYVNPVRTYSGLVPSLLSHLRGDDLFQLITLGR